MFNVTLQNFARKSEKNSYLLKKIECPLTYKLLPLESALFKKSNNE